MPKPIQIAHFVLKTYDVPRMRDWYCAVLNARVAFEKLPQASLITFDQEHHRLGIVGLPGEPVALDPRAPGLLHMAFTYSTIRELLEVYARLRDQGIMPMFTVNHGPTVSFYYEDPDGNTSELQVDRFSTAEAAQQFIDEIFDANPVGIACDPEALLVRAAAGDSDEQLMYYDRTQPPIPQPFI